MKQTIKLIFYSLVVMFLSNINIKAETIPEIQYQTHIQNVGWQSVMTNGNISGTEGQGLRLEAIAMSIKNSNVLGDISYQVHVENYGWMNPTSSGYIAGTEGQGLRLEAIKINLTGELEKTYDIYYQVHVENYGWIDWAKNGEETGSAGYAFRLEGIKIVIVKKGDSAPGNIEYHYYEKPDEIKYQTHIQDIGWYKESVNGEMSGTEGRGLRLEAIKLGISSVKYGGGITYQTHIQNIGWSSWVNDNNLSGTEGQGLRLEAIRIALTGEIADHYDVYYRTHIQNIGWSPWVQDGNVSGSTGKGLRLEAIEVKLQEKKEDDSNTPSNFIWYTQNQVKYLTNTYSGVIGSDVKKIIDVSEHQGIIDFEKVKNDDVDGVIVRIGYGSYSEDSKLSRNISELKRLNIPYGIYLFSYAENKEEALSEANFVLSEIEKYNIEPTLGVYYDLESWYINGTNNTNNISITIYDEMINIFTSTLLTAGYESSIYTNINFAKNKLSENARTNIKWIAQYHSTCNYDGNYKIWQYSDSEIVLGINGKVDMNVMFK